MRLPVGYTTIQDFTFYKNHIHEGEGLSSQIVLYHKDPWPAPALTVARPMFINDTMEGEVMVEAQCCLNDCNSLEEDLFDICTETTEFGKDVMYRDPAYLGGLLIAEPVDVCLQTTFEDEEVAEPIDWTGFSAQWIEEENTEKRHLKRGTANGITVYFKDMHIFVAASADRELAIDIAGSTVIEEAFSGSISIPIPGNWTVDSFQVFIYEGPHVVFAEKFEYVHAEICYVPQCWACMENMRTFHCLSTGNQAVIVLTACILGVVTIALIVTIVNCVLTGSGVGFIRAPSGSTAMMLILCLTVVSGCDSNLILTGNNVNCIVTDNGSHEECTLITQSLVTLPSLGSTLCLDILNEDGTLFMGQINVTYTQALAWATLNLEYWTSNRETVSSSTKICGGDQGCTSTVHCASWGPNPSPSYSGILGGTSVFFPGVSSCADGCGGWACNCPTFHEACTYGRWAAKPIPQQWSVHRVAQTRLSPVLTICYSSYGGVINCTQDTFFAGNSQTFGGNWTITFSGSLQASFNFFSNKLMVDPSKSTAYFVEAADKNLPIAGQIGELQANGRVNYQLPGPYTFLVARDICQSYLSDSDMHYTCVNPPLQNFVDTHTPLPGLYDGIFWSYSSDDKLVGDILNPGGTQFTLQTEGEVSFRTRRIQVCPKLSLVGLAGSWGTQAGARIILRGYSDCHPGRCLLSAPTSYITLNTAYLDLTQDENELVVFFQSNKKDVSFELTCTSLSIKEVVNIEGSLDDPAPIEPVEPPTPPNESFFERMTLAEKIGFIIGVVAGGVLALGALIGVMCFTPQLIALGAAAVASIAACWGNMRLRRMYKSKKESEELKKIRKRLGIDEPKEAYSDFDDPELLDTGEMNVSEAALKYNISEEEARARMEYIISDAAAKQGVTRDKVMVRGIPKFVDIVSGKWL